MRHAIEQLVGQKFISGNSVQVLRNGDEIFPAMLEAIGRSRKTIEFLTFVYWSGEIARKMADALAERARAGVRVRVLLDSFGAYKMPKDIVRGLEQAGCDVCWFRPIASWRVWQIDNRTHRKILVCDSSVAFTGGVGIAEEWQGDARDASEWRDTHFEISGPAVCQIQAAFWGNWLEAKGGLGQEALPLDRELLKLHDDGGNDAQDGVSVGQMSGGQGVSDVDLLTARSIASTRWSEAATLTGALLQSAEKRIRISTAYFSPDKAVVKALCDARRRGVDIDILFPWKHADVKLPQLSSLHLFRDLISSGVKLHRYQKTMLHTKIMLIDDRFALVGSANMNHRSWMKDDEVLVLIDDERITKKLNDHFADDLHGAEEMTSEDLRNQSFTQKMSEKAARLIRPEV